MNQRTHIRCDKCRRRYPVTLVQRDSALVLPRGWTKNGSEHACKLCSSGQGGKALWINRTAPEGLKRVGQNVSVQNDLVGIGSGR